MPKFVLKVLDGPDAGRSIPLPPDEPLRIGRKPTNQLRLVHDEKVSGQHAELRREGGMLVLADLGSTNGTRVDGKKVEEIPVAHGDRFQVGQTMLQLLDEELGAPVDEGLSMEIDREMLARSGRRSPVALLLLLLVVVGGGAAWWFLGRGGPAGGPEAPGARRVVPIPGNRLDAAAAQLEAAGGHAAWIPLAGGMSFGPGSRARSGRGGLEALLGVPEGEPVTDDARFAVSAGPEVPVQSGRGYAAQAWLAGDEGVRTSVRLAFYAAAPESPGTSPEEGGDPAAEPETPQLRETPLLVVGSPLRASESPAFVEHEAAGVAPPGATRARVLLVALLPASGQTGAPGEGASGRRGEARAFADDIALLEQGSEAEDARIELRGSVWHATGANATGGAGNAWLEIGGQLAIRSFAHVPVSGEDPPLAALAEVLPLPLTDHFAQFEAAAADDRIRIRTTRPGLVQLRVPAVALGGQGYLVRREAEGAAAPWKRVFEQYRAEAELADASGVLLGEGLVRFFVAWPDAGVLRVEPADGDMTFTLPMQGSLEIQLGFRNEILEAQRLFREAQAADRGGETGRALRGYAEVIARLPFDQGTTAQASQRRSQLLLAGKDRLLELQEAFSEAKAFGYEGLYRQLLGRLDAALAEYAGAQGGDFYVRLEAVHAEVQAALQELVTANAQDLAERYRRIHESLREADKRRLAELVKRYIQLEFPESEAAKALGGDKDGEDE